MTDKFRNVASIILALAPMIGFVVVVVGLFLASPAHPRELGQWDATSKDVRAWYRELMQPDNPVVSCCGESDAYWADSFYVEDGQTVAVITDDRPDAPLNRQHIPSGTKVVVPNHKLKFDRGNPTGHGVIFLGGPQSLSVYCYVTPGGV